MPTPQELEAKFWKALESDRTMMLGLDGQDDGHTRPMTAHFERERGPIWFFTTRDNALVQATPRSDRAIATFTSKGHDLFAAVHGHRGGAGCRAALAWSRTRLSAPTARRTRQVHARVILSHQQCLQAVRRERSYLFRYHFLYINFRA